MAKKRKLNLPQEHSVAERGEDIKETTKGKRVGTILGICFFSLSAAISVFLIVFTIIFMFSRVYGPSMMTVLNANHPPTMAGRFTEDSVIVNRFRTPQINDIIVTRHYRTDTPPEGQRHLWNQARDGRWFQLYIKRLIATEGDTIWVGNRRIENGDWVVDLEINGRLFEEHPDVDQYKWGVNRANPPNFGTNDRGVNDYFLNFYQMIRGTRSPWREGLFKTVDHGNGVSRQELVIPPGHVFFMGDNRLRSNDSRSLGPQPTDYIVGVAVSIARDNMSLPAWLWNRFVHFITFRWV